MTRHRHALVLGKFYPLHAGHQALIRTAQRSAERVTVEVVGSRTETIPVPLRARWIAEEHPGVRVVHTYDEHEIDYGSETAWQHHTALVAGLVDPADGRLDLVVSSDGYGQELARRLAADWVCVDPDRAALPVSGTAVRADVAGHWWALPGPVREHLCRRVVVVGAESTGTTTLARQLAGHYGVPWVPEFGREWTGLREGGIHAPWHSAEFDLVARSQAAAEDRAARHTPRPLLVCDTDVLATGVWHERYLGRPSPTVSALAAQRRPDLYLLTGDEIPFVDDGLRDGPEHRPWMTGRFRELLDDSGVPWVQLTGSPQRRLASAVARVDELVAGGIPIGPSLQEQQQQLRRGGRPDTD